ncbi:single-strand selective monofunctional uracil DNA glycosylase-like [Stegodyphus dumicola]|uniref:single-strand selective monofunctional uracil DNA glycosylase-like n=1 Tax=Stegodyphus dumicola TaxID=202533 RepID=UPI0015B241DF|nr:single-strand selective monofunctional uracil DNA glycosylase-like [Stegodyphus dumicola]
MSLSSENIADMLLELEKLQCSQLSKLRYGESVCYIYNPLDYAKEPHECYVRNYCTSTKSVLFLGMNPGPFGMAQNGVPFGDSFYVSNWLKIKGNVSKPPKEHPKRLIQGLNCSRSEVSGSRFWSFLEEICVKPDNFFRNCYVHNYCPFSLMTATAKNITPSDLKADIKKGLINICDESLHKVIILLKVNIIVGIGKFAETRAAEVVKSNNIPNVTVVGIMHPSPINPAANKGWKDIAYKQLEKYGILGYLL